MWSELFLQNAMELDGIVKRHEVRGNGDEIDGVRKLAHGNRALAYLVLFHGTDYEMISSRACRGSR